MVLPSFWKCEECFSRWKKERGKGLQKKIDFISQEANFGEPGKHECPQCKSEDVFPYRLFKCKACGHVADQDTWFPEFPLDDNPLEDNVPAESCEECSEDDESATLEEVLVTQELIERLTQKALN